MAPPARKPSGGRQATLSFNHRVTKASVPKQSAKEAALLSKKAEKVPEVKQEVRSKEYAEKEKAESIKIEKKVEVEEANKADVVAAEVEAEDETETETETKQPVAHIASTGDAPTEAEIEADAITEAQVRRYWRSIEAESISRRVHQEDLDLGEKILRHFDVSSQFGPCVGITRKKRWMRAHRLGLAPPIEVLAVMMQEEAKHVEGVQRSSFDAILNTAVAA